MVIASSLYTISAYKTFHWNILLSDSKENLYLVLTSAFFNNILNLPTESKERQI